MPSSSPGDRLLSSSSDLCVKTDLLWTSVVWVCTREIKGLQLALAQSLDNMMPWIPQVEHQRQQ